MTDIRMATIDDAAIIVHHRNRMFADMGLGTAESLAQMDVDFDIWLQRVMADGHYLGWFACDGDHVVAGAGLWMMDSAPIFDGFVGRVPYLLNVYTEPAYRKRGLARQLVNTTLTYCKDNGYPKMLASMPVFLVALYMSNWAL